MLYQDDASDTGSQRANSLRGPVKIDLSDKQNQQHNVAAADQALPKEAILPTLNIRRASSHGDQELDISMDQQLSDWQVVGDLPALIPAVQREDGQPVLDRKLLKSYYIRLEETAEISRSMQLKGAKRYYRGDIKKYWPHGVGFMLLEDGSSFEGLFEENKPALFSRHIRPNGDVYVGEIRDELPHGRGTLSITASSRSVECEGWRRGKEFGRTVVRVAGLVVFEGHFEDGQMHGPGRLEDREAGFSLEGSFTRGKLNGRGTKRWTNGQQYTGEFVDGKATGQGLLTLPDDRAWQGEFQDGRPVGTGKLKTDEGKQLAVRWNDRWQLLA